MESQDKKRNREIDVIGILGRITKEKKTLAYFCTSFIVLGVVVAWNTQKMYTSTVVLAPESSDASSLSGKLSSMTSMLGISLNGSASSDAIYPQLYPDVFASTDFQLSLFSVPVTLIDEQTSKPYCNHLAYDGKIPFWSYPRVWAKQCLDKLSAENDGKKTSLLDVDPFMLTKEQWKICQILQQSVTCVVDKKTEIITLSVTDIDPQVSAIVADTVMSRLQNYITEYRTKKARHDLEYISQLCEQSYNEYLEVQQKYAKATDSHRDLILKSFQSELENLENEMQMRFSVYSETSQQLQIARQRVQEKTPVFTVIQSPTIPQKASSTPRSVIVLGYLVLGIILDAIWVLFLRDWRNGRKNDLNNKKVEK